MTERTPTRNCIVNVVELRRRLGQRHDVELDLVITEQVVVGSRTLPDPIAGSMIVESIERGVSATGSVRFYWEGDCRRCLEPVRGEIDVAIAEIFQVGAPENADIIDFDGEAIDLLPIVRDAVALSLPLVPLCDTWCAGPDPERFPARTPEQHAEDADEPTADPRWAALDDLDLS